MTGPTARLDSNRLEVREAAGHVAHTDDRAGQLVAQLPGPVTERRTQMAPVPTKALDIASRGAALPRKETLHMVATAAPISRTIDRSACPSTRGHGTRHHRFNNGCTCPDGLRDDRWRRYRRATGRRLPPRSMPAIGAARRLQALAVLGYSTIEIGAWIGLHRDEVARIRNGRRDYVFRTTDRAVRDLAHALHSRPRPADPPGRSSGRARARSWALRQGWVTAAAWDDIDDPDETARRDVLRPTHEPRKLAIEDVEWLASTLGGSHDDAEIARHYGVTLGAVQTCRARAGSARRTDPRRSKLTDADAHAIRAEYTADPHGFHGETVAARYGVTGAVISRLITGKTRAHLGLTDLTAHKRGHHRAVSPGGTTREDAA